MLTDFGEIWLEHARITKEQKCSGILQFWIFFLGGGGWQVNSASQFHSCLHAPESLNLGNLMQLLEEKHASLNTRLQQLLSF